MDSFVYLYALRQKEQSGHVAMATECKAPANICFDADALDTFCFHWPLMGTYILVRVLESTIALLPVQGRLASLYYCAQNGTEPDIAVASSRQPSVPSTVDVTPTINDIILNQSPSQPSTLHTADVQPGWIHAPCKTEDPDPTSSTIRLVTKHSALLLHARSKDEKHLFLNLVKFKNFNKTSHTAPEDSIPMSSIDTLIPFISERQDGMLDQFDRFMVSIDKLERRKSEIASCLRELDAADNGLCTLRDAMSQLSHVKATRDRLARVQQHIECSASTHERYRDRVADLVKHVKSHSDFLSQANRRLERVRARLTWAHPDWVSVSWLHVTSAGLLGLLLALGCYYIWPTK